MRPAESTQAIDPCTPNATLNEKTRSSPKAFLGADNRLLIAHGSSLLHLATRTGHNLLHYTPCRSGEQIAKVPMMGLTGVLGISERSQGGDRSCVESFGYTQLDRFHRPCYNYTE